MATELKMPQMGYDMEEGTVVRWLKDENSPVEKNEPIAEIETDKAVVEFESETFQRLNLGDFLHKLCLEIWYNNNRWVISKLYSELTNSFIEAIIRFYFNQTVLSQPLTRSIATIL